MNGTAAPLRSRKRHPGGLWVPETLFTSRDLLIFVEEAAEAVVSFDLGDVGRCAVGGAPVRGLPASEVVPVFVEFEVAVPHLRPAWW